MCWCHHLVAGDMGKENAAIYCAHGIETRDGDSVPQYYKHVLTLT